MEFINTENTFLLSKESLLSEPVVYHEVPWWIFCLGKHKNWKSIRWQPQHVKCAAIGKNVHNKPKWRQKKNTGNREGERGMRGESSMLGPLCASHKHAVIFYFPSLFVATECSLWFLCSCNANRDSNIQRERKKMNVAKWFTPLPIENRLKCS